jgi:hypothetical protein
VDYSIQDARNCKNSSDNGANVDKELEKVFLSIRISDAIGRHLILKLNEAIEGVLIDLMGHFELEDFSGEPLAEDRVAKERICLKNGGNCLDVEKHF